MKLSDLDQRVIVPVVDNSRGGMRYEIQISIGELLKRTLEDFEPVVVDAVPVVHARWKSYSVPHWTKRFDDNGDPEYKYHAEHVCSACGRRTIIKEKYCPNCGALMDGDGDGEART